MNDLIELEKKIMPEMTEILEKRYTILRNIFYNQPIGRRALANNLEIGERVIRTEVNLLKKQGLLEIENSGMYVTEDGKIIIEELKDFIHKLKGLSFLEQEIEKALGIRNVIIVPGDSDENNMVLRDLGRTAASYIYGEIHDNCTIGITGGTTMARLAEEMPTDKRFNNVLVLPARGGLGRNVETQSNNIAAKLAQKLGGNYKLLHIPDNIGKEALETLLQIDEIKEIVSIIKRMDMLVFGFGRADKMAKRRQLSTVLIDELMEKGAVAEAFGYYFNTKGEIIWESNTVGITLSDFKNINKVIGIASGHNKAESIISICNLRDNMTLITDEGAARRILELVK